MSPFLPYCAPAKNDLLQHFRTCSLDELEQYRAAILAEDALPRYINTLDVENRTIALRASLVCWAATKKHLIPREMQLKDIISDRQGRNSLVSAGTGSGKTLPIAVNILLDNPTENTITITISPLKRLQVTQDKDSTQTYEIPTVVINEDTPGDESWWQKHIFNQKEPADVPVRHLIVTVEQLFKTQSGHLPRLGEWLRMNTAFQKRVVRINVDEAHFIYTAGEALYGLPAFRRAFGQLEHLKRQLPSRIRWHFYSALRLSRLPILREYTQALTTGRYSLLTFGLGIQYNIFTVGDLIRRHSSVMRGKWHGIQQGRVLYCVK